MKKTSGNLTKLLKIVTYDLKPIKITIFHSYAQLTEGKHMEATTEHSSISLSIFSEIPEVHQSSLSFIHFHAFPNYPSHL